jgi:polysaccharide biosynthesis transport protein
VNKLYPMDVSSGYPRSPLASPNPSPIGESQITIQRVIRAFRRRLNLMLAVFLLTFAVVAVFSFQLKPVYTATSSVIVNTRDQKVIDIGAVLSGMPANTSMIDTEAEILRSRSLIEKVVRRLDLVNNPDFNWAKREPTPTQKRISAIKGFIKSLAPFKKAAPVAPPPVLDPAAVAAAQRAEMDRVIDAVRGSISVNRVGSTYLIDIYARSGDPKMAAKLANTLADAYLVNQLDTKLNATRNAKDWLDQRVGELREEVRVAEGKVEAHRARTGLLAAGGSTLNEQAIRDLNAQLGTAQADLAVKRARLENANKQVATGGAGAIDTIPEALASPAIMALRAQQTDVLRRKADLQARYFDTHPDVVRVKNEEADLERQISAELRRILSSMSQDVMIARERVNTLQSQLNAQKSELSVNNRASVELNELQRDADASKTLYEEFLSRFKETNELEGITETDATINAYAPVPTAPSFPNTKLNLALGFMLGLALAGFVGLVTELLDSQMSSPEEVEQATGVPYIGQIPLLPPTGNFAKARIRPAEYLIEKPHSGFAEAYRHLRASIMFADLDKAAKTVAIVSSLPDEGKTSMTYCLGRMASMSGTKTIVIDGDLRRRQLTEVSGVNPEHGGLLEYLFGETRLADAVITDEQTGLHILPLSDRKHTPRDVFGSRAFDALLNMLQQTYDLIIIDTGPILLMAETRVVTSKVDQVVVAARWRKTSKGVLRETLKVLHDFNANIAGVVLTFVDLRKRSEHAYTAANYKAYAKYYRND